jgi:hypothetical protein
MKNLPNQNYIQALMTLNQQVKTAELELPLRKQRHHDQTGLDSNLSGIHSPLKS